MFSHRYKSEVVTSTQGKYIEGQDRGEEGRWRRGSGQCVMWDSILIPYSNVGRLAENVAWGPPGRATSLPLHRVAAGIS